MGVLAVGGGGRRCYGPFCGFLDLRWTVGLEAQLGTAEPCVNALLNQRMRDSQQTVQEVREPAQLRI